MGKKTRLRKEQERARREARRLTPGKVTRLLLKSVLFALVVSTAVFVLGLIGLAAFDNLWLQLALVVAIYAVSYPFLMSEFRPRTYLRRRRGRGAEDE